jgi:hypothetical protein
MYPGSAEMCLLKPQGDAARQLYAALLFSHFCRTAYTIPWPAGRRRTDQCVACRRLCLRPPSLIEPRLAQLIIDASEGDTGFRKSSSMATERTLDLKPDHHPGADHDGLGSEVETLAQIGDQTASALAQSPLGTPWNERQATAEIKGAKKLPTAKFRHAGVASGRSGICSRMKAARLTT